MIERAAVTERRGTRRRGTHRMNVFRRYLLALMLALTLTFAMAPRPALARDDGEREIYDARLEGYQTPIALDSGSTALTWLLLIVLTGICVGVMFMNPKRSHLD